MTPEIAADIRNMMRRTLDNSPESLLEGPGPLGLKGLVFADLIGYDGQIDAELTFDRVPDEWHRPIPTRPHLTPDDAEPSIRMAVYRPYGAWTTTSIPSQTAAQLGIKVIDPITHQALVHLVRYRRVS